MKKAIIILSTLLALVACVKETPTEESTAMGKSIDASKVVFDITVKKADTPVTKGIKTSWETGDLVYVFFEDNTSQYVKMTYSGTEWAYTDKDGTTTYSGLTLITSGKKLTAVYFPSYVNTAAPTEGSTFIFASAKPGFLLKADAIDYTVTTTGAEGVATLKATLDMAAPTNLVQVYVPGLSAPADGNEYVLTVNNVKPYTVGEITPGGTVTITPGTVNFPLTGISATIGSETGYYFWGILDNASAGAINYNFQLVEQEATKKYAFSSKSKTVSGKNLTGATAIKLSNLTDNGQFVDLGFGNILWATGNLKEADTHIASPIEAGDYYEWGVGSKSYDNSTSYPSGLIDDITYTSSDTYDRANNLSSGNWYTPTKDQMLALGSTSNVTRTWYQDWTEIGDLNAGYLITSNINGLSLFLPAAGYYNNGTLTFAGNNGEYWSSTMNSTENSVYLSFGSSIFATSFFNRSYGCPIRPVKGTSISDSYGKFTINGSGDKVYFSRGNLWASTSDHSASWNWMFAPHQYDYIGNATSNTVINGGGSVSYDGSVDLFGWSTNANTYFGINNSTSSSDYSGDFVDWGTLLGPLGWHTLSKDEWNYLLNSRSDEYNYAKGTIHSVNGLLIFPDGYNQAAVGVSITDANIEDAPYTSYSNDDWAMMEAAGVIFLPAAGLRTSGTTIDSAGIYGNYWSSTENNGTIAYVMSFLHTSDPSFVNPTFTLYRYEGCSVRLVRPAN